MKFLLYIIFIFFTLTSCRKSDEKMEELIVGEWNGKCHKVFPLDLDNCPPRFYFKFAKDSVEIEDAYGNYYWTEYFIENHIIKISYRLADGSFFLGGPKIVKFSRNRMKLDFDYTNEKSVSIYTYKKK